MAKEVLKDYNSTEQELYAIADLAYTNLKIDLVAFAAVNSKYTPEFLAALRLTRTKAMDLPNEEARDLNHEVFRNEMVSKLWKPVLDNFNLLKGYIKDGFPGEDPKPRYQAAGGTLYSGAGNKNWEDVVGLNTAMQAFIGLNTAALTSPGGMPGSFVTKVDNDADAFEAKYSAFMLARETGPATAEKIGANNLLNKELAAVLEDGATRVFRNNQAKQDNYEFRTLKAIVSPPGSSSLAVTVKRGDDTFVANAAVEIKREGVAALNAITDINGVAVFANADPGRYAGTVAVDGAVVNFTKELDTGVNGRITVVV